MAGDILHGRDGALADESYRDGMGARAVACDGAGASSLERQKVIISSTRAADEDLMSRLSIVIAGR